MVKIKRMKKTMTTFFVIFMATTLLGCANSNAAEKESKTNSSSEVAKHLTKAEFLELVFNYEENNQKWSFEGDIPCIIDFYADWCQPCKIAGPILEELAKKYEGRINVYKVNTGKERELAAVFGIKSIPTFMLCPTDGLPQVFSGIGQTEEATKEIFKRAIDEVLLNTKTNN